MQTQMNSELQERPIWAVRLSNGMNVYQDDKEVSSWSVLRNYCLDNKLTISSLWLQCRTNRVPIDISHGNAVYFAKGIIKELTSETSVDFYSIGLWKNGEATITKYHIPTLIPVFTEPQPRIIPADSQHLIPVG